ncbi:MAG: S8 family serine peptidase [Alistipes sp.]|nr:S8 family serine peptidase [Alistipes sp.]
MMYIQQRNDLQPKKMKSKFLYIVMLLLAVSCSSEFNQPLEPTEAPYVEGEILVKFSTDVAAMIDQATAEGTRVTRSGDADVDGLLAAIGACSVERVFPVDSATEAQTVESGLNLWYIVRFDSSKSSAEEVARRFAALGKVQIVDVNRTIKRAYTGKATPLSKSRLEQMHTTRAAMSDPLLSEQWNLINSGDHFTKDGVVKSVKDADVQCQGAWERSTGDNSVIVAVLDEGVFVEHPDLAANIWVNEDEIDDMDTDADENGYKGDIYGYNFVHNSGKIVSNAALDSGHGTHVAGIIAAVNNNGEGISSIAGGNGSAGSGVKIMVCQIFSGNTATSILSTVRAIKYAADNGAVVLQCSWGYISPRSNVYDWGESYFNTKEEWIAGSPLEREAIEYFTHYAGSPNGAIEGGIAVFAGGNESAPAAGFPGAADEYVSVAATAADFTPAVYTNYGPGTTISAPGGDQDYYFDYVDENHNYGEVGCILSTLPYHVAESGYGFMEGTSMACPHVSGVVALGISYATELRRHFKAAELQQLLVETAVPIDSYMTGKKEYCRYVADIGPIQPMLLNLNDFRGQMGAGQINAAAFLAAIAGDAGAEMVFPNIYVAKGGKTAVVPSRYFVDGQSLTYTVTIEDSSVASCENEGGKLIFSGLESGSTKAAIKASNGKSFEFSITVRRDANSNGWL